MKKLVRSIKQLQKSGIKRAIDKRIHEFKTLGKKPLDHIFNELCFCLMTANFSAQRSIDIQKKIGSGFHSHSEAVLAKKLKEFGHRFPNTRAKFIVEARNLKKELKTWLAKAADEKEFRAWLKENVKGLGYKEASHFLRNIGKQNCAIIDFHIVDILSEHGLIKKPKNITKKIYHEIENVLERLAKKIGLTLAELDLYLWYLETGKVLK